MRAIATALASFLLGSLLYAQRPDAYDPAIVYEHGTIIGVVDENGAMPKTIIRKGENRTPTWSPDGEWIVFGRRETVGRTTYRGIYVATKEGKKLCRIVDLPDISQYVGPLQPLYHPAWSPLPLGGKHWIIYMDVDFVDDIGRANLYAVEVPDFVTTGGRCTQSTAYPLTPADDTNSDAYPSWSPTADRLVAMSSINDGYEDVVSYPVTLENGVPKLGAATILTSSGGIQGVIDPVYPEFARTQQRLALASPRFGAFGEGDVWWADLPPGNANFNVTGQLASDFFQTAPTWSSDDRQLAFSGFIDGVSESYGLYKINADGTGLQMLVPGGSYLFYANWRRCNRIPTDTIPDCK